MEFPPPPSDLWGRDMSSAGELPGVAPGFDDWLMSYMSETLGHAPLEHAVPPVDIGRPAVPESQPAHLADVPVLDMEVGPGPDIGHERVSSTSGSAEHGAAAEAHTGHEEPDKASQRALKVAEKNR